MRVLSFWINFVASLLAIIGVFLALIGFINGNDIGMGVIGVLLVVVPVGLAIWLSYRAAAVGRPAFDAALANGFKTDMRHWGEASGIAIDKAAGNLALGEMNGTRIIPTSAVTEVSYVAPRVGAVYSGGIMAVFAIFSQIGALAHNFSQTGLYVAANGQRTRIIGMKPAAANEWQSLIAEAKART